MPNGSRATSRTDTLVVSINNGVGHKSEEDEVESSNASKSSTPVPGVLYLQGNGSDKENNGSKSPTKSNGMNVHSQVRIGWKESSLTSMMTLFIVRYLFLRQMVTTQLRRLQSSLRPHSIVMTIVRKMMTTMTTTMTMMIMTTTSQTR